MEQFGQIPTQNIFPSPLGPQDVGSGFRRPAGFGPGAIITTMEGEYPVEWLMEGDRIVTRDRGAQRLRQVIRHRFEWEDIAGNPLFWPVLVQKEVFGLEAPDRPLVLAQTHKILLTAAQLPLYFGQSEVLAEARRLIDPKGPGDVFGHDTFTYTELCFEQPEIVRANGMWCAAAHVEDAELARPDLSRHEAQAISRIRSTICKGRAA